MKSFENINLLNGEKSGKSKLAKIYNAYLQIKNPNFSIGIFAITSLSTFFFVHINRRIDRLLNRL